MPNTHTNKLTHAVLFAVRAAVAFLISYALDLSIGRADPVSHSIGFGVSFAFAITVALPITDAIIRAISKRKSVPQPDRVDTAQPITVADPEL